MAREIKELNDEDIRNIAMLVKERMLVELGPAKTKGFFGLFPRETHRFIHHTWVVVSEIIEGKADAKERT